MSSLRLAYLNLSRRRLPTIVALISIAVSVAVSGVLLRLYLLSASRFSTLARAGDMVVGAKAGGMDILLDSLNLEGGYPGFLPINLFASIKSGQAVQFEDGGRTGSSYVKGVVPFLYFAKLGEHRVIGTDESFVTRPALSESPIFAEGKWAGDGEVVLGSSVADERHAKLGDTVELTAWTSDEPAENTLKVSLRVAGILAPSETAWDGALFATLEQARKVLDASPLKNSIWKNNVLNYFTVYLSSDDFPKLENLINKRTVAQVIRVGEETRRLEELTGRGKSLGLLLCALIILLGGLSVAAMMVTRFDAMGVQLAVLRAIGFSRREIRGWLLWEGLLLGLAACLIGALLDAALFPALRAVLGSALPPAPIVKSPLYQSATIWVTALLSTMLAVFIPLVRLYRQDVHVSLKGM